MKKLYVFALLLLMVSAFKINVYADNDYADVSIDTNVCAGSWMYLRVKNLSLPSNITEPKEYYYTITTSKGKVYTYEKGEHIIKPGETVKDYWVALRIDASDPLGYYKGTLHIGDDTVVVWGRVVDKVAKMKGEIVSAKSPRKKTISLRWKKKNYATGYQFFISYSKDFSQKTLKRSYRNKTSINITNWGSKTTVYVKMRPYKKRGNKVYYGIWSKTKKVRIR